MKKLNVSPIILSISSLVLTFPLATFAISEDIFQVASYVINASVFALIGVATMVFMYGVILYVIAKGDEKQLASGKTYMLYGIIGLTAMVAVWGFVNIIIFTIFGSETSGLSSPNVYPLQGVTSKLGSTKCISILGLVSYCY